MRSFSSRSASVCDFRLRDMERKAATSSLNSSSGGSSSLGEKSPRATARVPWTRSATGRATRRASLPATTAEIRKTRRLKADTAAIRSEASASATRRCGSSRSDRSPGLRTPGTPGIAERLVVISSKVPSETSREPTYCPPPPSPILT